MGKRRNSRAEDPKAKRNKSGKSVNIEAITPERAPKDPDYYFEDGSVVLLVQDVLFKIHVSLLKAQSQVFQDMFTMPVGNAANSIEGTSDQHPIVIPQVKPSQFRNLLRMIYSPASSAFHASLETRSDGDSTLERSAWSIFTFYLDVATLCHRFGMAEMEEWAQKMLQAHISLCTEGIAREASVDSGSLLDAIQYSKTTQNHQLTRDIQHLVYYYICDPELDLESRALVNLFRTPGLRENHPSIFGCIFSTFLAEEHTVWEHKSFTKLDRMALFSGQVRLAPIPEPFKKDIRSPLFEKPKSLQRFRKVVNLDLCDDGPPCGHKCDQTIMDLWFGIFEEDYYEGGVGVAWFPLLARYRSEFVEKARRMKCCRNCNTRFIKQLDEDIELVFVRLGEYYRKIE
ncbi:unnamed protein product [Rhizoctonia solani]|uniref:BTB domain-containing protein n=3 Tax=Rhizoctonia solani TaxID=456999 RepID=A0A8H3H9M0_9AGAM|nr:BTB/POZ domain protein [Rhizoctonia solani AG-3 Rhs1AP]KEP47314.1 BTB/POZ domain protein [Rhizoctonia solani 123E]CAE6391715.1 unnamed protein product [Rhizoctonia solani]CAE6495924.1 unnamed protein product [Rhizoctonia solani]